MKNPYFEKAEKEYKGYARALVRDEEDYRSDNLGSIDIGFNFETGEEIAPRLIDVHVGESKKCVDDSRYIGTTQLFPCIGMAAFAKDTNKRNHRFVAHIDDSGIENANEQLNEFRSFILGIGEENIEKLKIALASTEGFSREMLDKREQLIISELQQITKFYKEKNPGFAIPFHRSYFIRVAQNGDLKTDGVSRMPKTKETPTIGIS